MRFLTIDCSGITDKAGFHEAVAQTLEFPSWYGKNLDALHDCLTEISEETSLTLNGFDTLGSFRTGFRIVLNAAEEENPHLYVYLA